MKFKSSNTQEADIIEMIPQQYVKYVPEAAGTLLNGLFQISRKLSHRIIFDFENLFLGEPIPSSATENCYSDSSENRLFPFKSNLEFESTRHSFETYQNDCMSSCTAGYFAYFGIQLTELKDGLECWCGHTQPLRLVYHMKISS